VVPTGVFSENKIEKEKKKQPVARTAVPEYK
jgi:hypothetical protein